MPAPIFYSQGICNFRFWNMSYALRFPTARLRVQNLLVSGGLSGSQAIIRVAIETGVIELAHADSERFRCGPGNCNCFCAARFILEQNLTEDKCCSDSLEYAWGALLARLNKYHARVSPGAVVNLIADGCQGSCLTFAPVLFDLLLQELHRHSLQ